MATAKKKPNKSLLGAKVKFNKVQAIALVAVLAVVGIVAFALTHASSYPAHLILHVNGPSNQSITFTSGPNPYDGKTHDVGLCYRSFAVLGAIDCPGNTIGPVSITAPVVPGYTFSGWTNCDSTSYSGASCNKGQYASGELDIYANYKANAVSPAPPPPVASSTYGSCKIYGKYTNGSMVQISSDSEPQSSCINTLSRFPANSIWAPTNKTFYRDHADWNGKQVAYCANSGKTCYQGATRPWYLPN